jgi:hypothetical protein
MEPFILRYGVESESLSCDGSSLSYDANSETCLTEPGASFAFTGSIITKATVDTTSDEAGDR